MGTVWDFTKRVTALYQMLVRMNYMELCQIHSIPIERSQGSYGIPIPETVGDL